MTEVLKESRNTSTFPVLPVRINVYTRVFIPGSKNNHSEKTGLQTNTWTSEDGLILTLLVGYFEDVCVFTFKFNILLQTNFEICKDN